MPNPGADGSTARQATGTPAIASAALMVCTYRRPETFAKLMASVAALELPSGLKLTIVVADNNPQCQRTAYVEPGLRGIGWPVVYGHEPVAGYSNARNKAIELAMGVEAEALLFVDDDMILDPGWLAAHLRSLEAFGCDVVNGRIYGVRERFPHGARLEKCGAGNVSFRRRIVDPAGLGLRFDPAFNTTGTEDQAFFRAATAKGADIRQSDWPLIYNYYGRAEMPEEEVINKMLVTASMHQNDVARVRAEKGTARAVLSASKGLVYGLKSAGLTVLGAAQRALGASERSRRTALSAKKERLKMRGRFAGISGRTVSRQEVRRSDPGA